MKVCVYTICKNELNNVDQWLDCMNEADYMVVVDTGSVDGTFEKLKKSQTKYKNLYVYKETINPWRFDVARNVAKSHIPADTDLCVSMDMDEVFMNKGWCEYLKKIWLPNYELGTLLYIDNKENNIYNKKEVILKVKIHKLNATWKYPIHEIPVVMLDNKYEKNIRQENQMESYMLDLRDAGWENLIVVHKSNKTSDENYVKLADLRLQEYPGILSESIKILELLKTKQYDKCYSLILEILDKYKDKEDLEYNIYKTTFYFYKGYIEKYYLKEINLSAKSFEKSLSYYSKNEKSVYELLDIYRIRELNNKIINLLQPFIDNYYDNRLSRYAKNYNDLKNWFYEKFVYYYNLASK